jgi:hypothetical protein
VLGRIVSTLFWRAAMLAALMFAANAMTQPGHRAPASFGAAGSQMRTALDDVNRALAMVRRL